MEARITAVTMPKWGIEMTEGTINAWLVERGQSVEKGAPLLEVETEKIVNTVEAPAAGVLRRVTASAGESRPVGALIGVLATQDVPETEVERFVGEFRGATVSFEPGASHDAPAATSSASVEAAEEQRVSPIARRIAERLGIDLSKVKGTGRNGRISKEDVEAYAAERKPRPAAASGSAGEATSRPLSATRATIARRLTQSSQSIPHYRLALDVDVSALDVRRQALRAEAPKISLNDLIVRAVALALVRHPALNARFEDEAVHEYPHAHVALAVATDSGLLTPVIRSADTKSVAQIAAESAELAQRARAGQLTREDLEGATFTVSNLGMFGVERFDAIINPPQVGILAVGAAKERVVVRDGAPAVARQMTFTLSADHRVIDGAVAAAFLAGLREIIEAPAAL